MDGTMQEKRRIILPIMVSSRSRPEHRPEYKNKEVKEKKKRGKKKDGKKYKIII
jgi:hypothetical protein